MFIIDPCSNRITPVPSKKFNELGFTERQHLQEWLEHHPEALSTGKDDELLIIQKEFDGFDDTRERLDLLAIDKSGNLVIIENKLDDSGRDVIWQALKYAGYCANLKKLQVVEIFQRYLNKKAQLEGGEAAHADKILVEFLQVDDLESMQINTQKSQRLIFVAANYRKEVTNTALWLSQFGISCQCFKATPYQAADQLFLSIEQIIPPPEVSDFMIGIMDKEDEEKSTTNELKHRHRLRLEFWQKVLDGLHASSCNLYNNISPSKENWLPARPGIPGVSYVLIFGKNEVRVELYIYHPETEKNMMIFQQLKEQQDSIEKYFGAHLDWQPLPNRKACRIQYAMPVDGYDKANWPEMVQWLIEHIVRLEEAMKKPLEQVKLALGKTV
ncbi:DUF4268 domain-containing protein [Oceanimonas pelagia]|uniref:DUF4268 domain-containing protein n=1 Tax=Oceanimonas pelagia TaxID=3028314 RepID=A0AA50KLM1_9GAMM|nr:DUF4268 domain-containing protein [Oceanimonas pelagia]WMC10095.1 DUF4268 domain-containing protein [Oceanimonas pelagia]